MGRQDCSALVAKWKRRLGLQDWTVELEAVESRLVDHTNDNIGLCWRSTDERRVRITIAVDQSPDNVERTVIHELLHARMYPLELAVKAAADQLGDQAAEITQARYGYEEHTLIEDIVFALMPGTDGGDDLIITDGEGETDGGD